MTPEANSSPCRGDVLRSLWMDVVIVGPIFLGFPFEAWFVRDSALRLFLFGLWMYAFLLVGIVAGWGIVGLAERWEPIGRFLRRPVRSRAADFVVWAPPKASFGFVALFAGILVAVLVAGGIVQLAAGLLPAPRWKAPGTLLSGLFAAIGIVLAVWATRRLQRRPAGGGGGRWQT
ncbi:MAG: hypothetical protein D6718_04705 [Acidobacteria bacterium]|nr:MAG: hypothetical protein D6718_04705 [Acidobacteriota bacterium]